MEASSRWSAAPGSIDMGIESDISAGARLLAGLGTISDGFGMSSREADAMSWSTRKCLADYCRKPAKNTVPDKLFYNGTKLEGPVCPAHHQMLRRHFQIDNNNPHVKCRNGRCAKKCRETLEAMLKGMATLASTSRARSMAAAPTGGTAMFAPPASSTGVAAAAAPAAMGPPPAARPHRAVAAAPAAGAGGGMGAPAAGVAMRAAPASFGMSGVGDFSMGLPGDSSVGLSSGYIMRGATAGDTGAMAAAAGAGADMDMSDSDDDDDAGKFDQLVWAGP